jgi:hypothetical protein
MHSEAIEIAQEINKLDQRIGTLARTSLELAIQIGMLLAQQKKSVPHGQWLKWVTQNLTFGVRRVERYLMVHEHRDQLKIANVSNLTEAYALLATPKPMDREEAKARVGQIQDALYALCDFAEKALPSLTALQAVRDSQSYLPEHATFDEYLDSLGISRSAFEEKEKLCGAAAYWVQGGSAEPLFDVMWTLDGNAGSAPWQEATVA